MAKIRVSTHTGHRLPSKNWLRKRIDEVKKNAEEEINLRKKQLMEHGIMSEDIDSEDTVKAVTDARHSMQILAARLKLACMVLRAKMNRAELATKSLEDDTAVIQEHMTTIHQELQHIESIITRYGKDTLHVRNT